MPDLPPMPVLPPDPTPSGLAGKRRLGILLALALLVAAFVAVFVWRNQLESTPPTTNTVTTNTESNTNTDPTGVRRYPTEIRPDADGDGLNDAEEAEAQTNPALADSDGDGLTDSEEIRVYKTQPLVQDSDGDGQTDKQEIDAGRNPNGPGMLRDLPAAINALTNN